LSAPLTVSVEDDATPADAQVVLEGLRAINVALCGQGLGRRLPRAAENRAWQLGCLGAYLETFEYRARSCYAKEGYTVYGTLDDYPPGHCQ